MNRRFLFLAFLLFLLSKSDALVEKKSFDTLDLNDEQYAKIQNRKEVYGVNGRKFRVAIIAAGEIRSFAFVARSWERYIFTPSNKDKVFLFAHAVLNYGCPYAETGLEKLQKMATQLEVSSKNLIAGPILLRPHFPEFFVSLVPKFKDLTEIKKGNVVDMYARRARAYEMAKDYAASHNFRWSLFCMIRLDSAFYQSTFDFMQWHYALKTYSTHNLAKVIYSPSACNFDGACDRFAVGLPRAMDIYFQRDWVLDVINFVVPPNYVHKKVSHENFTQADSVNHAIKHGDFSFSEHCLWMWFYMNNITQVNILPAQISFMTMRVSYAQYYCNSTRKDANKVEGIFFADRLTSYEDFSTPVTDFDKVSSASERCGDVVTKLYPNITDTCLRFPQCQCAMDKGPKY